MLGEGLQKIFLQEIDSFQLVAECQPEKKCKDFFMKGFKEYIVLEYVVSIVN